MTDQAGGGRAGFSAPSGENARRLQQLANVTTELGAAESIDAIVEAAVSHVAEAIQAAVTTLMLREGDDLVLVGGHGLRPGVRETWHRFAIAADTPASEAVRTAKPVIIANSEAVARRYATLRDAMPEGRSVVCLPLGAGADPVGVVGLTFEQSWVPGPLELNLLTTFAEACGQAVRRVASAAEAAERARQLRFLADASAELSSSLDYRATLAKVATLVVPDLADWCAVDILERGELSTISVAHVDPEMVAWAWELQRRYPPDPDSPSGAANVVRTGVSELYEVISDEMLVAGARDEEHLRLSRQLDLRSAIVVPLMVHGRALGAVTLLRAGATRPYGPADLAVAEDLGRRAGTAIDNALLHSQTRDVALQLQRAVLPEDLDAIAGWNLAVYYEPGGSADVGGDFYDAVPLHDGRLAVFIGDVMGHGVAAAASMAHMRASLRAFISLDSAPGAVLANMERLFELHDIHQLVSVLYAVIDPTTNQLELTNAGHYPPLIVSSDGTARVAETTPRRPLGTDPDVRATGTFDLNSDDTVLLYTDGLVERRDEHIDVGLQRALSKAGILARGELTTALKQLVAEVGHADADDDVTALAVRRS